MISPRGKKSSPRRKNAKRKNPQTKKAAAKDVSLLWSARFAAAGPYNISVDQQDCGAVYLGAWGAVYALSRNADLSLRLVRIPNAKHTCANHHSPRNWDQLHLARFGDVFQIKLNDYVGLFQEAAPGNAGRWVFGPKRRLHGFGDVEQSDMGG